MVSRWAGRLETARPWVLPVGVGVLALLVRVVVLLEQRAGNPLFHIAILDDGLYLDLAAAVTEGAPARPWFLAPLYPFVLGIVSGVFGPGMATASSLNVVVGTLTAICVALAARELHSQAAGCIAGGLVAIAGTFVFHDVLPGQEPLLCLLHVLAFWASVRWLRDGSPMAAGLVGLAAGVASMGRATSLGIALAAGLVAVLRVRPRARLLPGIAALALGLAVVLVPAALRNRAVAGDLTPFPWSGGVNLYIANGPDARAETAFVSRELGFSAAAMEENARRLAEQATGREMTPGEISTYWSTRARAESGGAGEMLPHLARKAALFWSAAEYGNNHYVALERRFSVWLRIVPVSGWWLLALGVGGWWLVRRRRSAADVAAITIGLTWAALTIVYPVSRYRLPVLPLATILAAAGLVEVLVHGRRAGGAAPGSRRLVAGALVVAASTLALAHGAFRPPPVAIPSYTNLGTALLHEGRASEAEEILREGLLGWPDDGPARLALGRALAHQGRHAEALEEYARAERDARTQWTAGVPALRSLVATGQADRAESVGAMLLRELPPDPALRAEMLAWWALAAHARGDRAAASERIDAARAGAPEHEAVIAALRTLEGTPRE